MENKFTTPADAYLGSAGTTEQPEQEATSVNNTDIDYEQERKILLFPGKKKPSAVETKSKHMQCLVTPSLYKQLEKVSKKQKDSVNGVVNRALKYYLMELEKHEEGNKQ